VLLGDRGYDAEAIRCGLRGQRIRPFVAMRRTRHGSGRTAGTWKAWRQQTKVNRKEDSAFAEIAVFD